MPCAGPTIAALLLGNRIMSLNQRLPQAATAAPDRGRPGRWGAVLVLLALVAVLDAETGYEVSVFLLYMLPVAAGTHYLGKWAGVAVSLLSTVAWAWADHWSGHTYSQDWILFINALNRLCCFLLAVVAIQYVEERRAAVAERLRAFTGEVPGCTQCQRLCGEDGHWRSPAAYLGEFGGAQVLPKACPDCARRAYARAAYRETGQEAPVADRDAAARPEAHA